LVITDDIAVEQAKVYDNFDSTIDIINISSDNIEEENNKKINPQ